MDEFSFLNAVHSEYIEELYQKYLKYPDSVEPSWKSFFQGFDFAHKIYIGDEDKEYITKTNQSQENYELPKELETEFKVINLIQGYRSRGHLFTKTNPVRNRRNYTPTLDIENFGLTKADLNKTFKVGSIIGISEPTTLSNIIQRLESMYCTSIGVEYMHIRKPEVVEWIQDWININSNQPRLSNDEKKHILTKLSQAVAFESFLHTKFVGQKRFSLEGGESLIPALDELIEIAADNGVKEIVVGMAHRGRLNVLANIFNKSYSQIFSEFEGKDYGEAVFSGDVKYHLGSTNNITVKGQSIKINLAPNPSHLETVGAIVGGITRAKSDDDYNNDYNKIIPIIIHGDAAIAAQGIVYEVIQMVDLEGYKVGGTIHIVVNNQIGFTTNYTDGRSSTYCTDISRVTLSPVLHVNADDVEAVIHSIRFAAAYRAKFNRDVFIDLLGYRKYGHNEGDEPRFTQPKLYDTIAKHLNPRDIYKNKLFQDEIVNNNILRQSDVEFKDLLEISFASSKGEELTKLESFMPEEWLDFKRASLDDVLKPANTKFKKDKLIEIAKIITTVSEDKNLFNKTKRLLKQRWEMIENDSIDWGMAELLAYGSLLYEGHNVRLSGEDVKRGTFSHRHSVIITNDDEEDIIPLNTVNDKAKFMVYNSLLSEYGVLGFDYGYAMAAPKTLTIWEAQFGDFANGAQIIFDQYVSAAEDKWKMQNGLVMLLPHGFEGQGAEHSSARIERFLHFCANGNMFIINATTPANIYHALRRQIVTDYRKPLVVFSPKSLLRHPKVVSTVEDLSEGSFQEIIDDNYVKPENVNKLILCSGKIYYDLLKKREELKEDKVALIRIEQLYPLNWEKMNSILDKYKNRRELFWVQEEPENMGPWWYISLRFRKLNIDLISPPESSSPSPGSHKRYDKLTNKFLDKVFSNLTHEYSK